MSFDDLINQVKPETMSTMIIPEYMPDKSFMSNLIF